jgi:hypothetical protein
LIPVGGDDGWICPVAKVNIILKGAAGEGYVENGAKSRRVVVIEVKWGVGVRHILAEPKEVFRFRPHQAQLQN